MFFFYESDEAGEVGGDDCVAHVELFDGGYLIWLVGHGEGREEEGCGKDFWKMLVRVREEYSGEIRLTCQ